MLWLIHRIISIAGKKKFENTKGELRSDKWKNHRQYNGQKIKEKMTNNDLQNTTCKLTIEQ